MNVAFQSAGNIILEPCIFKNQKKEKKKKEKKREEKKRRKGVEKKKKIQIKRSEGRRKSLKVFKKSWKFGSECSLIIMCNAHAYVETYYCFLSFYMTLLSFNIYMATISKIT